MNKEEYKTFEELKEELGTDYDIKLYEMGKSAVKEIERLNKDLQTAIDICNNRQKEIVRLNNIINELEKDMRETMEILKTTDYQKIDIDYVIETLDIYYNRLKELKEGK